MSLIYLVTSLPALTPGIEPPISSDDMATMARRHLEGPPREELELLLVLADLEETVRITSTALAEDPSLSQDDLLGLSRRRPDRCVEAPPLEALPLWVIEPQPEHRLLRRWLQETSRRARSPFLRNWSAQITNLRESVCGLLCKSQGLSQHDFETQMEGRFDSSSHVILSNYESPDLGIRNRFGWFDRLEGALRDPDLLAMEHELLRLRWELLERCHTEPTFSIDTVLVTWLQLRLLERESSWSKRRGEEVLDHLLDLSSHLGSWTSAVPDGAAG